MKRKSTLFLTAVALTASSLALAQNQGSDLNRFVGSFSAKCINQDSEQTAFNLEIKLDESLEQGLILETKKDTWVYHLEHFERINQDQQRKKFKGEESCYITETQSTLSNGVINRKEVITGCSIFSSRGEASLSDLRLEENGKMSYSKKVLDKRDKVSSSFSCQLIRK